MSDGGKGGGSGVMNYYGSVAGGICNGPVDELVAIILNGKEVWPGGAEWPGSGAAFDVHTNDLYVFDGQTWAAQQDFTVAGNASSSDATIPGNDPAYWIEYTFSKPDGVDSSNFTIVDDAGVNYGVMTLYWGTQTQQVDSILSAAGNNLQEQHPPYKGVCYIVLRDFLLGTEVQGAPNIELVIRNKTNQEIVTGDPTLVVDGQVNLAAVAAEIITGKNCIGQPNSAVDADSFAAVAGYLNTHQGIAGASVLLDTADSVRSVFDKIAEMIDGFTRFNAATKKVELGVYEHGTAPAEYVTLTADDFTAVPKFSTKSWQDTKTRAVVNFSSRQINYSQTAEKYDDARLFKILGMSRTLTVERPFVCRPVQARVQGIEALRVVGHAPMTGTLEVRREKARDIRAGSYALVNVALEPGADPVFKFFRVKSRKIKPTGAMTLDLLAENTVAPIPYQAKLNNPTFTVAPAWIARPDNCAVFVLYCKYATVGVFSHSLGGCYADPVLNIDGSKDIFNLAGSNFSGAYNVWYNAAGLPGQKWRVEITNTGFTENGGAGEIYGNIAGFHGVDDTHPTGTCFIELSQRLDGDTFWPWGVALVTFVGYGDPDKEMTIGGIGTNLGSSIARIVEVPTILSGARGRVAILAQRPTSRVNRAYAFFNTDVTSAEFANLGLLRNFAVFGCLTDDLNLGESTIKISLNPLQVDTYHTNAVYASDALNDQLLAVVVADDLTWVNTQVLESGGKQIVEIVSLDTETISGGDKNPNWGDYVFTALRGRCGTVAQAFTRGAEVWIIPKSALVFLHDARFENLRAAREEGLSSDIGYFRLMLGSTTKTFPLADSPNIQYVFPMLSCSSINFELTAPVDYAETLVATAYPLAIQVSGKWMDPDGKLVKAAMTLIVPGETTPRKIFSKSFTQRDEYEFAFTVQVEQAGVYTVKMTTTDSDGITVERDVVLTITGAGAVCTFPTVVDSSANEMENLSGTTPNTVVSDESGQLYVVPKAPPAFGVLSLVCSTPGAVIHFKSPIALVAGALVCDASVDRTYAIGACEPFLLPPASYPVTDVSIAATHYQMEVWATAAGFADTAYVLVIVPFALNTVDFAASALPPQSA